MIFHRHSKMIMGGGVCLLIALSGVVATANVVATPNTDTYIETSDTAEIPVLSTATFDVATPTTPESQSTDTVSKSTSSQETISETCTIEEDTVSTTLEYSWDGPVLNSFAGIIQGPSGSETYYNLDMSGVVSIMKSLGYDYNYWVRDDGVKMYGEYVMCAADLSIRPKGTIIETSLGLGMVCDTGGFVASDSTRLDIAVNW